MIIDSFNGEIGSYSLSERPVFNQIAAMLNQSFEKIWSIKFNTTFRSGLAEDEQYHYLLKQKGIKQRFP